MAAARRRGKGRATQEVPKPAAGRTPDGWKRVASPAPAAEARAARRREAAGDREPVPAARRAIRTAAARAPEAARMQAVRAMAARAQAARTPAMVAGWGCLRWTRP